MKMFLGAILTVIGISVACAGYKSTSSPSVGNDASPVEPTSNPSINPATQEKSACSLSLSQAPVINGLKLGMTTDEVLALFPGSKEDPDLRSRLSQPPNQFGASTLVITPSKYETKEKLLAVSQITLRYLDGRVYDLYVGFNGPAWPHVDKFVENFVAQTSLPAADQWQPYVGLDSQMKTVTCTDFEIRIFAGGPGGSLNYVQIQDLEADKKLKERRKKAREQASPTPGQ